MNRVAAISVQFAAPAAGLLLGLLGFTTLGGSVLSWFLFLGGVAFAAGSVIFFHLRGRNAWQPAGEAAAVSPDTDAYSSWALTIGLIAVLLIPPLELLYLRAGELPARWLELAGAAVILVGSALFLWAAFAQGRSDLEQGGLTEGYTLTQAGPYRLIRHPRYAGCLLVALGFVLGYMSLAGCVALLGLLLPAVLLRIRADDRQLAARFGPRFLEYASSTKRLIPGLW